MSSKTDLTASHSPLGHDTEMEGDSSTDSLPNEAEINQAGTYTVMIFYKLNFIQHSKNT